jgi:hypothetical protein
VGFGGALAGTPVAEIVDVDAVDNIRDPAFLAHFIQAGEEFVFAVEAAIFVVLYVFGVIEFEGFDVFVADVEVAGELFGVAFVGLGDGGGIGSDGDGVFTDGLDGGPGKVGGICATGIGDDDVAHFLEDGEEGGLLAEQIGFVQSWSGGRQLD